MRWNPMARWRRPDPAPGAAAFEDVVLPHLDAAYNFACWLVGDPTLAEDVVQDATVRALRYFGSYRGQNARAWLLRIVRNTAHEARAARAQQAAVSLDDAAAVADPADDPEAALRQCQDRALLADALAGLPVELRECLVLRELEELSYKEIAQVTEIPIGTVMSRLWRARQALLPAAGAGR